jgi:hypothetical protein
MKDRVPSGRGGNSSPWRFPPATLEVGSSLRKLGEEVTYFTTNPRNKKNIPIPEIPKSK